MLLLLALNIPLGCIMLIDLLVSKYLSFFKSNLKSVGENLIFLLTSNFSKP